MAPLVWIVSVAATAALVAKKTLNINKVAMRFFRDVARSKARKRLYGNNQHALIPMLLDRETPHVELELEEKDALYLTRDDLESFKGHEDDDVPLYLSIRGRIYDVSQGRKFYGPDGKYHLFVGTDATRAFATGCLQDTPECISSSTEGLSEKELKELNKWIELYDTHDKYQFVGYLVKDDPIDAMLDQDEMDENSSAEEVQESSIPAVHTSETTMATNDSKPETVINHAPLSE